MRRLHRVAKGLLASAALACTGGVALAQVEAKFPATLAGQAVLPALTLLPPPADAPKGFEVSGKFAAPNRLRETRIGATPTASFTADPKVPRSSGVGLPLQGQPVQGFSGIEPIGGGAYLVLTDNGYGSRVSSPDTLLMVHRVEPDWANGRAERRETLFLHDPDRKVPFHIGNENTDRRYLTGADFDPESIRLVGEEIWVGDEFGPYLLRLDRAGKVLEVVETKVADKAYRSPDHYMSGLPNVPGAVSFDVRRSRGFEPMGKSPDARFLYPAFEGPVWDAQSNAFESRDGRPVARILEFSVPEKRYTGRWWHYPLSDAGNVLGDLAMIDADSAVLIERDDATEGARDQACQGELKADCFNKPAAFKRVVKVVFGEPGGAVRKVGHVDLLDIADPDKKAHLGARPDGRFALPHQGPEGLAVVDAEHVVLVNDNNLPYSSGRTIGKPDENEITLLRVPELLRAK